MAARQRRVGILVLLATLVGGLTTYRQRKLAANARRFGLPT